MPPFCLLFRPPPSLVPFGGGVWGDDVENGKINNTGPAGMRYSSEEHRAGHGNTSGTGHWEYGLFTGTRLEINNEDKQKQRQNNK